LLAALNVGSRIQYFAGKCQLELPADDVFQVGTEWLAQDKSHCKKHPPEGFTFREDAGCYAFGLRVGFLRSLLRMPPACSYSAESGPKLERMLLFSAVGVSRSAISPRVTAICLSNWLLKFLTASLNF